MCSRGWAVAFAMVGASAIAFAQERAQPTFRAGVQLVRIDVSVLDEARQPVRGLQASDFTVTEDGQPRPIRSFTAIDRSAARPVAAGDASATNVATNQSGDETSRLIVILMDRSIPTDRPMFVARQIADATVDAMAPGDLAAIVSTGGGVPQNFTSDRARLHKAIAGSEWSQGLSAAQKDDPIIQHSGIADPLADGRCVCGLCVMDSITRIANDVRDIARRKVLFFIGSDLVVQVGPSDVLGCNTRVRESREKLFDALATSNLTIHSIDPQGLASIGPATRASVPNGTEGRDSMGLSNQLAEERRDFMKAQGNLGVLPDLTGGRTILNSNEPFRMIPSLLHESEAYYLLAFDPVESAGDVRHTIDVKVNRKGVTVHTARYLPPATAPAAAPATTSPIELALAGLLPDSSLPLGMSAAVFAGPDRDHAWIGITLDASAFATAGTTIPLELAVLASDQRGTRVGGGRQSGTVQVPAANTGAALVELQTFLTLPPGDYDLRAAVMNAATHAASSVFTHITVPAFNASHLSMSDIVLGTKDNTGDLPDSAPAIPIAPTTARVFSPGEPAWAFVRTYSGDTTPVTIETALLDSSGALVRSQSQRLRFASGVADVRLGLPMRGLAPGRYTLRLSAKSQDGAGTSRTIAFSVMQAQTPPAPGHSPELDAALAAAASYLEQYEHRITAIGAEEDYKQVVESTIPGAAGKRGGLAVRNTRGNIMTLGLGGHGWVSFRDVFEVDGRAVRDRMERLSGILQHVDPDSLEKARQIAAESARYNIDPPGLTRTINVPMMALYFLRAANQPRSLFRLGKPDRIDGVPCVTLQFTEQSEPRLIQTGDHAAAQGTFWIDMANGGRVLKTELRLSSVSIGGAIVHAQTIVSYAQNVKLDLWVPSAMDEEYELGNRVLTGHAEYSAYREFKVTTAEGIK